MEERSPTFESAAANAVIVMLRGSLADSAPLASDWKKNQMHKPSLASYFLNQFIQYHPSQTAVKECNGDFVCLVHAAS